MYDTKMALTLKTIPNQQLSKGTKQWKPDSLKDLMTADILLCKFCLV